VKPSQPLQVMLWRARPDMSCAHVSRAWLEFTGLAAEQASGEGWTQVVHPEDLARWLDACVRAFDARAPLEVEYRMRRHDGEYRWVLDRAVPLQEVGAFTGFAGACVDIDERKRAELGLARALERERALRAAAEEAARAKDELLAAVLAERQAPLLSGVRVLVMQEGASQQLVKMLEAAGADARGACSRAEALELVERWHPHVLLSERGEEGCLQVRSMRGAGRALVSGAGTRLAKPVEPVALVATVARVAHA
jgi:PAS domain S-box-containing protein